MIRACFAAAALAVIAGCATAAPPASSDPIEPFVLQIDIGRLGVMLGHVEELTREMAGQDADPESRRELARKLRETVWEYNLARSQLCARGLYTDISCGPAFAPQWLSDRPDVEPPLALLQDRQGVVGARVMQLWDRVCGDARQRAGKPDDVVEICGIE